MYILFQQYPTSYADDQFCDLFWSHYLDERFSRDLQLSEFILHFSSIQRRMSLLSFQSEGPSMCDTWRVHSNPPLCTIEDIFRHHSCLKKVWVTVHSLLLLNIYINKRILVLFSLLNDSHSKKYHHQACLILLRYWHFVSILYRIFFTYSRIKRVKLWSIFLVHFSNIYIDRVNIRLSIYLH